MTIVRFERLTPTAKIPTRATPGSVGWDLYADETQVVPPRGTMPIRAPIDPNETTRGTGGFGSSGK
jgi:dUTPase